MSVPDISRRPTSVQRGSPAAKESAVSAVRLTITIAAPGLCGMLAMFALLARLQITSVITEAVVGTLFMMVVMIPVTYLSVLRPLRRELQFRAETERALQEAQAGLEDKVQLRTAELEQANVLVQHSLETVEQTHREIMLVSELLELLQACANSSESQHVMARFGPKLFPGERGSVYLYRPSRNLLELATGWGGEDNPVKMFPPDDCWALRRGREHLSEGGVQGVYCRHLQQADSAISGLCVPMMAHGETTGMLVLEGGAGISESTRKLAVIVAGRIALGLSNLQLREKLRTQAVRDPLTAMFNRRYFEETATRELLRARECDSPVGIIMIDVDHFKRFNDSHGHEAGDAVLQRVGLTLQGHTRVEDVVCRYGGEEFVMLLPGLPGEAILRRAEELREAIRDLNIRFRGETLAKVTISCGVSVFPGQGRTCAELIDAADHALYRAKQAGRDRVEIAA